MQVDHRTANEALVRLASEAELEIFHAKTTGALMAVLYKARQDALQNLVGLVSVDPAKTEDVRKLQNEVQRFIDLLGYVRELLHAGDEAMKELEPEQQELVRQALLDEAGEEE